MSMQQVRVNKIEYGNSILLSYNSPTRQFLIKNDILLPGGEGWEQTFEIDVLKLKQFVDYASGVSRLSDYAIPEEVMADIEANELLDEFAGELSWAEKNKEKYILYHEF